jgi:hypothetical protein
MTEPFGSLSNEAPLSLQPVRNRAMSGRTAVVLVLLLIVFVVLGAAYLLLQ